MNTSLSRRDGPKEYFIITIFVIVILRWDCGGGDLLQICFTRVHRLFFEGIERFMCLDAVCESTEDNHPHPHTGRETRVSGTSSTRNSTPIAGALLTRSVPIEGGKASLVHGDRTKENSLFFVLIIAVQGGADFVLIATAGGAQQCVFCEEIFFAVIA